MEFEDLLKKAAKILECELGDDPEEMHYTFEVETDEDETTTVYAWFDDETEMTHIENGAYIYLESDAGEYSKSIKAIDLLREASDLVLCRLYVDEEEDDSICLQAALLMEGLTPELVAATVYEIATESARIEAEYND